MKKMLALLLTLCLLAGMVPLGAGAEGTGARSTTGTVVTVIKNTDEWYSDETKKYATREENYWGDKVTAPPEGYSVDSGAKTVSIGSAEALAWWAKQVNSGISFEGYTVNITADLNLSANYWTPICTGKYEENEAGTWAVTENKVLDNTTINGNGHTITGLGTATGLRGPNQDSQPGDGSNCFYDAAFIGYSCCNITVENLVFQDARMAISEPFDDVVNKNGSSMVSVVVGAQNGGSLTVKNVAVRGAQVLAMQKASAFVSNLMGKSSLKVENCEISDSTFSAFFMVAPIASYGSSAQVTVDGIKMSGNAVQVVEQASQSYTFDEETGAEYWSGSLNASPTTVFYDGGVEGKTGIVLPLVAEVNGYQYPTLSSAISAATENATVKLLKGTTENVTISRDKTLTLDLNGKTLSGSMKVKGNLTIQDSATGGTISNTGKIPVDGGRLTLKSGTISVKDDYGVYVLNGGSATINGGTISSKYSALAGNNTTGDMNFVVTGGTLTAKEGPAIYMPGQITMNISGGTLNGGISLRMGQITISGGTINATNGTIDAPENYYNYSGNAAFPDALYVLNGTYTSQNETYKNSLKLTITGGTFNCANSQGSAVAIYDLGKVAQESKVTISGDAKFSTNAVERSAYQVLTLSDIGVDSPEGGYNNPDNVSKVSTSITSGYFTSDPSEYCDDGLTGVANTGSNSSTYPFTVGESKVKVETAVAAGEPEVSVPANVENVTKETVEAAVKAEATQTSLQTAAKLAGLSNDPSVVGTEKAAKDALEKGAVTVGTDETVTVVVQPYLDVAVQSATTTGETKSMTVEISAKYNVIATTADDPEKIELEGTEPGAPKKNAVIISKNQKMDVTSPVTITLPLPDGFVTAATETIFVQHKGYEYEATVTSDEEETPTYTATFTNPHGFSTFVLSTETKTVATVNGTNYTNFQQAVNAAGTSTIEVKADGQTATGVTHNLKLTNGTNGQITVAINGKTITIPANGHATFIYTAPTPPRPTEEKHSITISTDGKGQVTGPASAAEDDKVTLTVKPNADKELYDLKITDEDGKAIAVTKVNDTTYTFTMPDGKVTVAATFGCDGGDNCPSKAFTDLGDKQWYHDSIDYAVEHGLLEGTSPTTMEPNATLIRAQLAQILYNIEDKPAVTGEMVFEDVPASEWFYSPILWANQNEIINGTSPITFEPLEDISRQDLALMLYRYAGKPAVTGDLDGFTDGDQVGDWAEEAMAWAVAEGIVQGDTPTTLNPTGTATRAEAAAMLQRFLENAA